MIKYRGDADRIIENDGRKIYCFNSRSGDNLDQKTVDSFGEEWTAFNQFDGEEIERIGSEYFDIMSKQMCGADKVALDVGCGSGRWTIYASKRFKFVEGIDPSKAVIIADKNTSKLNNVRITQAGVDEIPFHNDSFDFVFSLGVLHHIPDTAAAIKKCVEKLKPKGYILLYLYYALENRGFFYKLLFNASSLLRFFISKSPSQLKKFICDLIAYLIYMPLVFLASLLKRFKIKNWKKVPLSYYVGKSTFVIRNDALDRFGTPLEQRFTKEEISKMMQDAGLTQIVFSEQTPYWHVIGKKE